MTAAVAKKSEIPLCYLSQEEDAIYKEAEAVLAKTIQSINDRVNFIGNLYDIMDADKASIMELVYEFPSVVAEEFLRKKQKETC